MTPKPPGLSGYIAVRNAVSLDYPVDLAAESLVPICEEVVIGDMQSNDGTREMLHELARKHPNIRVVDLRDWTAERANPTWWTGALNECRSHIRGRMQITIDADEVLSDDEETHRIIREACEKTNAVAFNRLNFVKDATHTIPENECCGKFVVRLGPARLWMPSDEYHPRGEIHILDMAAIQPTSFVFHLGFLRRHAAFYAKARVVLGAFFGNYDQRLIDAEAEGVSPMSKMPWYDRLTPYNGPYPASVRAWMTERGYTVPDDPKP